MVKDLETSFHIDTSISALDRALSKMEVTWKNAYSIPYDWNSAEVLYQRQQYLFNLQCFLQRPKIYLDESGFHLHIKKSKGRALAGEKAKLSLVPKGPRVSLIAALSESGYAHYELFNSIGDKKRGVNGDDFRSFLLNLAPKIPRNSVLVLDNCKIHHAELLQETWKMLQITYGIDHLFLPAYSPFLNPIELSFNALKISVKNGEFYNRGDLLQVIERSIVSTITPENSTQWFAHCTKFYQQCALGLPFSGKILCPDFIPNPQPSPLNTSSTLAIAAAPTSMTQPRVELPQE